MEDFFEEEIIPEEIAELEKKTMTYWWNPFSSRKKDYAGTYAGFLREKDIVVERIRDPGSSIVGYRCKFSLSSTHVTIDRMTFLSNFGLIEAVDYAIMTFLMLLGDKATFENSRGIRHNINW